MRYLLPFQFFLVAIFSTFQTSGQDQSRLALVIGNSNYDAGELRNPANDAEHVAETLEGLSFDVILATNLETKRDFLNVVREFGSRRVNYDVAFVYYAGHGVEIGRENYLLPTKETFNSEYDVQDYGVSVQNILRYLNGVTEKVNVLILDACRNNPFESRWNPTRSLVQSGGLAKTAPPTGSLIAFSTEEGETADDGAGELSVYCESLCLNFKKKGVSLDQIFRNVRADVLEKTSGNQRPIESSQLTGEVFYMTPPSTDDVRVQALEFLQIQEYDSAMIMVQSLLVLDETNKELLTLAGHISALSGLWDEARKYYRRVLAVDEEYFSALVDNISWGKTDKDVGLLYSISSESEFNEITARYEDRLQFSFEYRLADARTRLFDFADCEGGLVRLAQMQEIADDKWQDLCGISTSKERREMLSNNMMYACECAGDTAGVLEWAQNSLDIGVVGPWPYIMRGQFLGYGDGKSELVTSAFEEAAARIEEDEDLANYVDYRLLSYHVEGWLENREVASEMGLFELDICRERLNGLIESAGSNDIYGIFARYKLGCAWLAEGRHYHALKEFSEVVGLIKSNPSYEFYMIQAYLGIASIYYDLEEYDLSLESVSETMSLFNEYEISTSDYEGSFMLGSHSVNKREFFFSCFGAEE